MDNFYVNKLLDDGVVRKILFKRKTDEFLLFDAIPIVFEIVVYQSSRHDCDYEVILYPILINNTPIHKKVKPYCVKCNLFVDLCKGRFIVQLTNFRTSKIEFEYFCRIKLGDDLNDIVFAYCGDEKMTFKTNLSNVIKSKIGFEDLLDIEKDDEEEGEDNRGISMDEVDKLINPDSEC